MIRRSFLGPGGVAAACMLQVSGNTAGHVQRRGLQALRAQGVDVSVTESARPLTLEERRFAATRGYVGEPKHDP